MKKIRGLVLLWGIFLLISIFSSIFLFVINSESRWNLLFLLPLSYAINLIIYNKNFSNNNINYFSVLLINGFYFIRYVISPIFFSINGYPSKFILTDYGINRAIIMMIYEEFIVFTISNYIASKNIIKSPGSMNIDAKLYRKCKVVLLALISFLLLLYLVSPTCISIYRSGLDFFNYEFTGFDTRRVIKQYASNVIDKFCIVTFRYVFNILRILIPCLIATMLKYKQKSKKLIIIVSLLLMLILNFLIMDDTIAYGVCFSLVSLVYLSILFNDNYLLIKALLSAALIVFLYFLSRFFLVNSFGQSYEKKSSTMFIASILQGYFSGFTNVAAGFNIPIASLSERIKFFVYEILRGVPYATTVFHLDSTSMGTYFNYVNNSVGQIIPTLTACRYYFGFLLSPVISAILSIVGVKSSVKTYSESNAFKTIAYIVLSLYGILGIAMYSIEIICIGFFCIALPIFIIGKIQVVLKNETKDV